MPTSLKVFIIEPFNGGSHAAWLEGIEKHSGHQIIVISHSASSWRWRVRGSALTLAELTEKKILEHGNPDLILASSMLDLPAWLGFTRRFLGNPPVILYQHENQLTYPVASEKNVDDSFKLINWKNMSIADSVWFNSEFHYESLFSVLPDFLKNVPDFSHLHQLESVREKSEVVPLGVELSQIPKSLSLNSTPLILWNHRWEYDKNPKTVFLSLKELANEGLDFNIAVAGEYSPSSKEKIESLYEGLGQRIIHSGYLPKREYFSLLSKVDVVVSASLHEFFGISIVEAVAAGALPVLPNRLSYPEVIPNAWHEFVLYDEGEFSDRLRKVLTDFDHWKSGIKGLPEAMQKFDWAEMIKIYDKKFDEIA